MATRVTNVEILEALRLLGIEIPPGFNTSGRQHEAFMVRVANLPGVRPGMFAQAEDLASKVKLEDYDPQGNQVASAIEALRNRGVPEDQITQIIDNAKNLQRTQRLPGPTWQLRGEGVSLTAVMQSAGQILGPTSPVLQNAAGKLRTLRFDERALALPAIDVTRGLTIEAPSPEERAAQRGRPIVPAAPGAPGAAPPGTKAQPGPGAGGPTVAQQVQAGITAGLAAMPKPKEATPAEIRALVNSTYGWAAGLADIPEIATILDLAASGQISVGEVGNRFKASHYYKTTTEAARNWKVLSTTAPGDAATERSKRAAGITALVRGIGIEMDPARFEALVDSSLRYGWNDEQIKAFLANEVHYDPTRAKTGMLASMKEAQRQFLVPLGDSAMSAWASAVVAGTKTPEDFDAYLRESASSLFPALGEALKDPNMTTRKYLDPYSQTIAKTLGGNAEDIDWLLPEYQRFITQVDPKTNARTVMPLSDVQRTLMNDPIYKWDETAQGRQAKSSLSTGLMKSFGFA